MKNIYVQVTKESSVALFACTSVSPEHHELREGREHALVTSWTHTDTPKYLIVQQKIKV